MGLVLSAFVALFSQLLEGGDLDYYRRELAFVHDRGYRTHADACAPGILAFLEPVRERRGLVLELGCGSGALTRHLVDAGHRVIATDASPAMLELAREQVPEAEVRRITLPDDRLPPADAVVSVGHVLNYLPDEAALHRALAAAAGALRPAGLLALDLCDLEWARRRREAPPLGQVGDDWAIVTTFSVPAPNRFVRDITAFVRQPDGSWRRDDERHENVLADTALVPATLRVHGVEAQVRSGFGSEALPAGLVAVMGHRPAIAP